MNIYFKNVSTGNCFAVRLNSVKPDVPCECERIAATKQLRQDARSDRMPTYLPRDGGRLVRL